MTIIFSSFYRVAFRKKIYPDIETLHTDLDAYMLEYNTKRIHQGNRDKTPMETFIEGKKLFDEKNLTERKTAA